MAWVKLDDGFAQHPKLMRAGPLALAMQVAGLCYANRFLTDGHIPAAVVPTLLPLGGVADVSDVVASLVKYGLWTESGEGYEIHDYLEYQPSREEALALREARRDAGRRGGEAKRDNRAKSLARPVATAKQKPSKTSSKNVAKLYPDPDPDPLIKEHMSSPSTPSRTSASDDTYSEDFEAWWQGYPRKVRKHNAYTCWKTRLREGVTIDALMGAGDRYAAACRRDGTEVRFIMHPATFLGKGRAFEDYLHDEPERKEDEQAWQETTDETIRRLYDQTGRTPPIP